MSALIDPISRAVLRWAERQAAPAIARLDLRHVPIPDEQRGAACNQLRAALGLQPTPIPVDGRLVKVWVSKAHQLAVVVALSKQEGKLVAGDAWLTSQDFAIRLRDLHSEHQNPLSALHLLLVLDSDMESLSSTSVDLSRSEDLAPINLVREALPDAGAAVRELLALEAVGSALGQALRDPRGSDRIGTLLENWQHGPVPPPEAFLTELLGWFPDPELVAQVEEGSAKANDRAADNKLWADRAARLREKGADKGEWLDVFDALPPARVEKLREEGTGAVLMGEVLRKRETPKVVGFRYRKSSHLCTFEKPKKELHCLLTEGKGTTITVEYTQAAKSAFRLTVDGTPFQDEAAWSPFVEIAGKDIRLKVPDNASDRFVHYSLEIYYGRQSTRARPSQTIRALSAPPPVPDLLLDSFLVGDVDRRGLQLTTSPPTLIETPGRRVTRTRTAVAALDHNPVWSLPARIEAGPSDVRSWKFEADNGHIFELPIACDESTDADEAPPYFGALLDPSFDDHTLFWTLEADGRGIQSDGHTERKLLSPAAQDDLRRERTWVDNGWLTVLEDARHDWTEPPIPGSVATHPDVVRLRTEYKRLFAWLLGRRTLPSLVEPWDREYWSIVEAILEAIKDLARSTSPGLHNRILWATTLGCVRDTNGLVLRSSSLWPPALAAAASLAGRLRESKTDYPDGLRQSLSAASSVPINLAAPGSGRLAMARRRMIWTWNDWIPVDRQEDATHGTLGKVFRNTLDRFMDSFQQLCGPDVPAPIRVRFVHILPDAGLVRSIEAFLEEGLANATWTMEKTLELEFLLDQPEKATALDTRLDPGQEDVSNPSGTDTFRACVKIAKLHGSILQSPPPGWDPYAHITLIGSVTQYSPGVADAERVQAANVDGGLLPSRPVDLVMQSSGRPLPFGAGLAGLDQPSPLQAFALIWNRLVALAAFGSADGAKPIPTVTPQAMHGRFPVDLGSNSKWLVYVDPGVGLVPLSAPDFMGGDGTRRPILVHFTTSSARGVPGYSDVTLTEHVTDMEDSLAAVCVRFKARPASQLLPVLNSLNGSWLLKVVKAETRQGIAEYLLAMATAGHDLLPRLRAANPDYIWLVAGWEDFHWTGGGAGNDQSTAALIGKGGGSDDILAIGVRRDGNLSLVPVVTEVKYGTSPLAPGFQQVRRTTETLAQMLAATSHAGYLFRAQFGQYILRAAERMVVHRVLPEEDASFLQENQGRLRQGLYDINMEHAEANGYVIHVDPDTEAASQETQQGMKVLRLPFSLPLLVQQPPGESLGPTKAQPPSHTKVESHAVVPAGPSAAPAAPPAPTRVPKSPPITPAASSSPAGWREAVLRCLPRVPLPGSARPDNRILTIDRLLREFKVEVESPEGEDIVPGPQAVAVHLRPAPGVSVPRIRTVLESLQVSVGSTQPLSLSTSQRPGYVTLFIPQNQRARIPFLSVIHAMPRGPATGIPIPAGVGASNEILWLDLRDTNHLLLAGATGSGKTVYLKGVLLSLVAGFSPKDLRIHLIDPKGLDFTTITQAPHFVGGEAAATTADAIRVLESIEQEIARRKKILAGARSANIFQFREQRPDEPLPFEVVVIDEYNQLRLSGEKEEQKRLEALVCQLAQIGRAYGIYLIVATQRPSVEVITGDIKANFPTRMSFRVASGTDSRVILDQDGAETLLPRGDGLIMDTSGRLLRFQAADVVDDDVRETLKCAAAADAQ